MEITNDIELAIASKEAGKILQQIQDYLTAKDLTRSYVKEARVRFPRQFIRTALSHKSRLFFIKDKTLRSNISYIIILSDIVLWLINRTDIYGTAKEMLYKLQLFIMGSIVESITKEYLKNVSGTKSYAKRTEYLVANNIIKPDLKEKLDLLWDKRNKMHLFLLEESEYSNEYTKENHLYFIQTFRELLEALKKNYISKVS